MKTISKITLGLFTASLLFVGCNENAAPKVEEKVKATISEESLGLRKTNLYVEAKDTAGAKTSYATNFAGSGVKINRAFQDAPPMIPHDTDGMLPIKINNNACTGCHMPDVASSMGATPIPVSHFTNFRPHHKISKDGKDFTKVIDNMKNEKSIKHEDKLYGGRFNCSQCHAPQSEGDLVVENNFEPDYVKKDGMHSSSWKTEADFLYGLDTVKGKGGEVTAEDVKNANSKAGVSPWTHH